MRFDDAVVLVTGASGGIGAACAAAAADRGASVIVSGRDEDRLQLVAAEVGAKAIAADLRRPDAAGELARAAADVYGRLDVVVHCAGVGWRGPTDEMSSDRVDELLDVNVRAPIRLTHAVLPGMLARGSGHHCYLGSIAGWTGVRDEAVYSASKSALIVFAESLRAEYAGRGVGVSVVSPGGVRTAFFDRRGEPYGRRFPRQLSVERVADAVVRGIELDRAHRMLPRWLALAPAMRATVPPLFRALHGRFG